MVSLQELPPTWTATTGPSSAIKLEHLKKKNHGRTCPKIWLGNPVETLRIPESVKPQVIIPVVEESCHREHFLECSVRRGGHGGWRLPDRVATESNSQVSLDSLWFCFLGFFLIWWLIITVDIFSHLCNGRFKRVKIFC